MHRSLEMLLIRTRFTWYYLVILSVIAIYSLYAIPYQVSVQVYSYGTLYFTGIIGVFSVVSAYIGGISVSKSDQEFLLVSPIPRRSLIRGFLIVQSLGTGLLLIAVTIFALATVHYSFGDFFLAAANLVALDIFLMTIGIATFQLKKTFRILIAVAIAAWILSFFLNFPLAPQNFMIGSTLYPLFLTVPVAAVSFYGAVKSLSKEDLPIRVSTFRTPKTEYKSAVSYIRYSPTAAVFMNGLTNLSYSTNSLMAGGIRTRTSKIRLRTYYAIIIVIAVVYGYLAYFLVDYGVQDVGFNLVVIFGAIYVGIIPQFIFNSGVITYERAWLSFTSMEPWKYVSIIIGSKVFQSVITSIPFVVVSVVDHSLGVANTVESAMVFMILDPLLIGLYLFMVFSISTYQITDEGFLSTRMSLAQFVPALPIVLFTLVVVIAIILPLLIIVTSIATASLLIFASTRKGYWENRVNKMVQKGFL